MTKQPTNEPTKPKKESAEKNRFLLFAITPGLPHMLWHSAGFWPWRHQESQSRPGIICFLQTTNYELLKMLNRRPVCQQQQSSQNSHIQFMTSMIKYVVLFFFSLFNWQLSQNHWSCFLRVCCNNRWNFWFPVWAQQESMFHEPCETFTNLAINFWLSVHLTLSASCLQFLLEGTTAGGNTMT